MLRPGSVAALTLAAAVLVTACTGRGVFAAQPSDLFPLAPDDVPTKVVTLEVTCGRGRLVADSATVSAIERMPGVYAVRRGGGKNTVHVLVDDFVRPESIGERLEPECTGRVVSVEKPPAR